MNQKDAPQTDTDVDKALAKKLANWQADNPKAQLTQIEEYIDSELAVLRRQLVEQVFQERLEDEAWVCIECERPMANNGKKRRQLQIKGGETVKFERQQKRCHQCGMTLFPPR